MREEENTALIYAAKSENIGAIRYLLSNISNKNRLRYIKMANNYEETALFYAAHSLEVLILFNINIEYRDRLIKLLMGEKDETLLMLSSKDKSAKKVKVIFSLITKYKEKHVNSVNTEGDSALMYVIRANSLDVVLNLLKNWAKIKKEISC